MSNEIQNIQHRLAMAENAISFLTNEVQRLSGAQMQYSHASQSLQTAIPLQGRRPYTQHVQAQHAQHAQQTSYSQHAHASQSQSQPRAHASQSHASHAHASHASQSQDQQAPIPLSEILTTGEVVTFGIFTGRDENGIKTSTVLATFDGTDLTVTECDTVSSLVGLKTAKAGEILFKFMNGLKEVGLIERTFNALPWRLASVQRDGQKVTLAQLRANKA